MRLVLLGPPGVGKGTQGERLARWRGVPHVSTGALLRELIASAEDTERVREARVIEKGGFVTDAFANGLALDAVDRAPAGFVLDGYPRTVAQAEVLDAHLMGQGVVLTAVIALEIDAVALAERVSGRRVCPYCRRTYHVIALPPLVPGSCDNCGSELERRREEDAPEKVALRCQLYQERTAPLQEWYRAQRGLLSVSGSGTPDAVFERICAALVGLI